jgi:hypothetical protein
MLDQDSIILASSTSCAIVPNNAKRRSQMTFIDGQILRERRGEVRTETQCSPSKLVVEPPGQCLTEYIVTGSAWGNSGTYPLRSGALRWFWFHTPKEQGLGECSS